MAARVLSAVLLALAARSFLAEQVSFHRCPDPDFYYEDEDTTPPPPHIWNCTINDVSISPCAEAAENLPCRIKRGKPASIVFDFTPEVASHVVEGKAYWATAAMDLPLPGMNKKGCQFTQCPLQPNHKQRYTYNLTISKSYQPRLYDVKWRVYNEDIIDCCFIVKIKLVK